MVEQYTMVVHTTVVSKETMQNIMGEQCGKVKLVYVILMEIQLIIQPLFLLS